MSGGSWWVTPALWVGSLGLLVGFLLFVSSPTHRRRMGRGGFSVQHLHNLQSVWEPGHKYVFEQKQAHLEESDDEGGSNGPDRK
jgi:hypothetical protein